MYFALVTILGSALGLNAQATDGVAVFTRRNVVMARTWKPASDTGIEAVTTAGESVSIASNDMLAVFSDSSSFQPAHAPRVVLQNGEVIAASFADAQNGNGVTFTSPLWGEFRVPLEQLARYVTAPAATAQVPPPAPYVLLKNGDALAARVKQVGAEDLIVDTEFGDTPIATSTVAVVVLTDEPSPVDDRARGLFLVELVDGQRIYCDGLDAGENGVLVLQRGQARGQMRSSDVRRVVWPGAVIGRPSAMPFAVQGAGYFGQDVIVRRELNAFGQRLCIGERWFEHGLGTRPESRVVFELSGQWRYLHGWVGLDSWLGRSGDCLVEVKADDHGLFKTELKGANSSTRVVIALDGTGRLELVTGFGAAGDLGDYVNWCDLLLVGEKRGENK